MSKVYVDEISHQSSQGSGTITIGASGETVNVVGTLQNNGAGVGGTNTPAFRATMSADQTGLSSEANTKVAFNTETFDEGSCYDPTTNYRFTVPTGEGGKYLITAHIHTRATANAYSGKTCRLYKNGSFLTEGQTALNNDYLHQTRTNNSSVTTIENLSAGDYIEVYGKLFGSAWTLHSEGSYFSACKLIT